jgi:small subunit ribosomal protein S21
MSVRIVIAEGESIGQALKRFRKLLERLGVSWEQRRRGYFIKPTQIRRAKRFKKIFKARKGTLLGKKAGVQPDSSISESIKGFWRVTGKP